MESFATAWNTEGFRDIVDISLIPWGHGQVLNPSSSDRAIWCQHGEYECLAQRITACVATLQSNEDAVQFVIDLATEMFGATACDDPTEIAQVLASTLDFNWQDIADCVADEGIADDVTMQYWESTAALDPALDPGEASGGVGRPCVPGNQREKLRLVSFIQTNSIFSITPLSTPVVDIIRSSMNCCKLH